MSKRRKNAGEGYGYMFHGAFAEKKDAVAKERKTKGAFIRGTPTKHGYRYIVMSPRTNPIKRKKKRESKAEILKRRLGLERCGVMYAHGMGGTHYCTREKGHAGPHRTDQSNPSELLIMGANPSHGKAQEIKIPIPGGEVTIRTNPAPMKHSDDSRYMLQAAAQLYPGRHLSSLSGAELSRVAQLAARLKTDPRHNIYFGFGPAPAGEPRLTLYRKPRGVRMRSRTSGESHDNLRSLRADVASALVNQGYKPAKAKQMAREASGTDFSSLFNDALRRNPSAEALREKFTGTAVDRVQVMDEPHMPAGDYALLGKLLSLYVKPRKGGQVQEIRAAGGTALVSDETARQIYFVGGDQDISSGLEVFGALDRGNGLFELGEATRIDYKQRKEHVDHPEMDSWRHSFGEETGERPTVLYDARAKRLLLEGGAYVIRAEGIVN